MALLSPFLSIPSSCDKAMLATKTKLSQAGLSSVQTFNLNAARSGLHDCTCPNHGTEVCECQMIVLLVYGKAAEPAALILHGNNNQTWISVADSGLARDDQELITSIRDILTSLLAAEK